MTPKKVRTKGFLSPPYISPPIFPKYTLLFYNYSNRKNIQNYTKTNPHILPWNLPSIFGPLQITQNSPKEISPQNSV